MALLGEHRKYVSISYFAFISNICNDLHFLFNQDTRLTSTLMMTIISCISLMLCSYTTLTEGVLINSYLLRKIPQFILQAIEFGVCFFNPKVERKVINFYYKDPSAIGCIAHLPFVAAKTVLFLKHTIFGSSDPLWTYKWRTARFPLRGSSLWQKLKNMALQWWQSVICHFSLSTI